jgi:hypothetical protein
MTQQQPQETLTEWVQDTVDRTTSRIEEIHRSIATIPLDIMRETGFLAQLADDVADLQERSIHAVYTTVRDVNRRVTGLAADLLEPPDLGSEAASEAERE